MKFSLGKEWDDLKKFENLTDDEKSIVFYSENENSSFIFNSLIDELTTKFGINICYVTSSKDESILKRENDKIKTFYIGDGAARTKFFLYLRAKIIIMTMPDLETLHIKRSKIFPVEYVYVFHAMVSTHLVYRKAAFDNFDTIFCVGNYQIEEIRNAEKVYNLKPKNLVKFGYPHLDNLLEKNLNKTLEHDNKKMNVLLAPSWSNNGIFEKFSEDIIEILLENNFKVIFRPHPMSQKHSKKKVKEIFKKFSEEDDFSMECNISNFNSFSSSDIMITDWSGSSLEFAFGFEKPILFVDVPKKINNPEFKKINLIPIEVSVREKIGKIISPDKLESIPKELKELILRTDEFQKQIVDIRNESIFNIKESKKYGAETIIELLNTK
tara:strand:- start:4618 stop:5763 length:1146 start_codon:yes stop_codon:yes gene_type:complete